MMKKIFLLFALISLLEENTIARQKEFLIGFSFKNNTVDISSADGTSGNTFICTTDTVTYKLNRPIGSISNFRWAILTASGQDLIEISSSNTETLIVNGIYQKAGDIRIQVFGDDSVGFTAPSFVIVHLNFKIIESPKIDLGNDLIGCPGSTFSIYNRESISDPQFTNTEQIWNRKIGENGNYSSITGISTVTSVALENIDQYYRLFISVVFTGTVPNPTCEASKEIKISSYKKPAISAGSDTVRCFGSSLKLNPKIVTPTSEPYSYFWSPNANISSVTDFAPTLGDNDLQTNRTYSLVITDANQCKDTATVQVTKNSPLSVSIVNRDTTLCAQNSISINTSVTGGSPIGGSYNFAWSPVINVSNTNIANPRISPFSILGINYTVTATDFYNCKARDVINIKKSNFTGFISSQKVDSICSGRTIQNIKFRISGGNTPFSYTWSPANILVKQTDSTYSTSGIVENNKIVVSVIDGNSCLQKDSMLVRAIPLPVANLPQSFEYVCIGTQKQINSVAPAGQNANNYRFVWSPNENINNINSFQPIFSGFDSEREVDYVVSITSIINGCANKDTLKILSKSKTQPTITKQFEKPYINTLLGFTADPEGLSYSWIFSDINNTFTGRSISQSFDTTKVFQVKLFATNEFGCVGTDSTSFETVLFSTNIVFIPNVFSPNAQDARNQTFRVFLQETDFKAGSFSLVVYNVLGQKVYESKDLKEITEKGWDGSNFPSGVYNYVAKGEFIDNELFNKYGEVVLLK